MRQIRDTFLGIPNFVLQSFWCMLFRQEIRNCKVHLYLPEENTF